MTQTPTKTLHPDIATIIAFETANTPLPTRTPLPTSTFTPTYLDFGIEIKGLNQQHLQIVLNAANLTGRKLIPYIPESRGYSSLAFRIAMSETTIMIDKDAYIDDYGGICLTTSNSPISLGKGVLTYITSYDRVVDGRIVKFGTYVNAPQTIVCKEAPDEVTLIHEFDHLLVNQQTMVQGTNFYDLTRSIPLGNGKLLDFQDGYWIRQGAGFQKGESSWAHRPYTEAEKVNGVGKIEHAADMFMNWVYDGTGNPNYGFTDDAAGIARRQAMEEIIKSIFGQ